MRWHQLLAIRAQPCAGGIDPLGLEPIKNAIDVARREFGEELGAPVPDGQLVPLGTVRQAGGKVVHAWALEGDFDLGRFKSNTFEIEWPPRSGRMKAFPEVDRAGWFDLERARRMLLPSQLPLLDRLVAIAFEHE